MSLEIRLYCRRIFAESDDITGTEGSGTPYPPGESANFLPEVLHYTYINTYIQVKTGMDATYFGFRWITLLLSQEFLLPGMIFVLLQPLIIASLILSCRGDQNLGFSLCR